jgi:tetratricopeptide (TPR) repeat protein
MTKLETAKALFLKGVEQLGSGDHAGAERHFRAALQILPASAPILTRLAIALYEQGKFDEAYHAATRAVAIDGKNLDAHLIMLGCLRAQSRFSEAIAVCGRIVEVEPGFAQAFSMRGAMLSALDRHGEALVDHDRALALDPNSAPVHLNRGVTLSGIERLAAAVTSYDRAIELHPDYAEAHSNRGNTLRVMGRFEEALSSYERAITAKPELAEAHNNRGSALQGVGRFEEALSSYDRAIALEPDFAEAHNNRGAVLRMLGRWRDAVKSVDRAIEIRPDYAEAHWHRSLLNLQIGDYRAGWQEYEWRWQVAGFATDHFGRHGREYREGPWLGRESLHDKTILLYAEQGFGDIIQFCRYVPEVGKIAGQVVLQAPATLKALLASLDGRVSVVTKSDPLPPFDAHCPLISLPLAFGTEIETIPASVPYLSVDPDKARAWRERLGDKHKLRIGLSWTPGVRSGERHEPAVTRETLAALLGQDAEFHSLQKPMRSADDEPLPAESGIADHRDLLADYGDIAALVGEMDLVIATDMPAAHLAGALGKPVWIVLPFAPDFRWLVDREDSPWYPTARLFVPSQFGHWDDVVDRVLAALRPLIAAR